MTTTLKHKQADVFIDETPSGKNKVVVKLRDSDLFMPRSTCETTYPIDLIESILDAKGPNFLCDEILREESDSYVKVCLKYDLLSYVRADCFEGKRLLDFGCGSGASTMILARMFPKTDIVGIELEEKLLAVAEARASFYGFDHLDLMISPRGDELPPDAGQFDFVVMSAVYEHLLPGERATLLPKIWKTLKPGGVLFLNQTPHRYFPVETHTTGGLPLINYMPARTANYYARSCSPRKLKDYSWERLLRAGIRGGNAKEIMGILDREPGSPILLRPSMLGVKDGIDLWYKKSGTVRMAAFKKLFQMFNKAAKIMTRSTMLPTLTLAIKKRT
jgi:2-polyprenyl-3-methyl-5-hydroxy-6-metoxy-1,4-benzoquinol methylase